MEGSVGLLDDTGKSVSMAAENRGSGKPPLQVGLMEAGGSA